MMRIGAIILAAGMSTRMGQPKQWLPLNGKPLFRHAVETAVRNGLDPVYLVGGEHAEQLSVNVRALPVTTLSNPDFSHGMSSSIKVGVSAMSHEVTAAFIFLADEPFVPDAVIQAMLTAHHSSSAGSPDAFIIRPRYAGHPGHPVLFPAHFFPELLSLEGDMGARDVLKKHTSQVTFIDFENPVWGLDVDTPDDWQRTLRVVSEGPILEIDQKTAGSNNDKEATVVCDDHARLLVDLYKIRD